MSSISAYCKARILDGSLQPDQSSLHSAFPGVTGAHELAAGSYARKTIAYGASSGGVRTQSGSAEFNVGSADTVRWVGYWQSGNWLFAAPAGGANPRNFVALAGDDTIYSPLHGWADGQKVSIFNGTAPGGIDEGQVLYVVSATTNTLKLSVTSGGAAIDMTSSPSWGAVISAINEYTYPSGGVFILENSTIVVPD